MPGVPPIRKSLGQHFLADRHILSRIVDVLDPQPTETVVEIGAGRGTLTDVLRARCGRVVAIEYDRALAARLRDQYAGSNVTVVEADVLKTELASVAGGPFALIGNVPYYITTPILFHALARPRADRAVYLVQREVAERMAADPGGKTYGALSVNVQAVATVQVSFRVPAGAFVPPPKVESAVVRIAPRRDPDVRPEEESDFREMVQAVFGMRRKQMRRVLRALYGLSAEAASGVLSEAGIAPDARPEVLSPAQFAALLRARPSPGS